jgi:hypothetical protein
LSAANSKQQQVSPNTNLHRADKPQEQNIWRGEDLFLTAEKATTYKLSSGEHLFVLSGKSSMSIGAQQCSGNNSVVWLT